MRNALVGLFIATWPLAATADDADKARATVETFYDGFNTQNAALLTMVLAEDYVVHGTSPGLQKGSRQDLAAAFAAFAAGVSDLNYEIEAMHVAGDLVTVRGTITGVHTGSLFNVPASGASFEFGAIDVHRLEDDQVVESWHVEDFLTLLGQIGALPARF